MPKTARLIVGFLFFVKTVSSDGDVHGGSGFGLESTGLLGGYRDYGTYGRYTSPQGYFKLGYSGIGRGLGYNSLGSGHGIGYYPRTIHRLGDVYGSHGFNDVSQISYGSPVGYNSFGYNNIGLGYKGYGTEIQPHGYGTTIQPHFATHGYGATIQPHFATHGYGATIQPHYSSHGYRDYTTYGFSPSFGYGYGVPHGYVGNHGGYGVHGTGGIHQSTDLVKAGYGNADEAYKKELGEKGQLNHETADGFSRVHDSEKNAKDGAGYYADIAARQNDYHNVKSFQGADQHDQTAKKGEEGKNALAHKKGHVTKSFETSHHKDETGKTTTFFDEANDEGDRYNYDGQHGSVADSRLDAYHGGLKDSNFHSGKQSEKGEYDQGFIKNRENANKFAYHDRQHHGNNNVYGENSDTGSHTVGKDFKSTRHFQQYPYFQY